MRKRATLFLFLACAFFTAGCARLDTPVVIERGIIDLSHHDRELFPILDLNGEWEYYPGQILNPEEISRLTTTKIFAPVPGSFNLYKDNALKQNGAGTATYRLVLELPAQIGAYTFRFPRMNTASRVFINGHLELSVGLVSKDPLLTYPQTKVRYIQLPLAGKTEILIQVSNSENLVGGIPGPITMGSATLMEQYRLRLVAIDIIVCVALLTFGLYHIFLFFLRNPERATIFYGAFCVTVSLSQLFTGEVIIADIFPRLPWGLRERLNLVLYFLDVALFILYVRQFFPDLKRLRSLKAISIIFFILVGLALFLPFPLAQSLQKPVQILVLLVSPFGFYLLGRLALQKVYGANLVFFGLIFVVGTFLSDTLSLAEIIRTPMLVPYAILLFTFLQAILITGRSLRLYRENEELSQRLIRVDKLRDDFLGHTSHELRTPVQAMVQMVENIRRGVNGGVSVELQNALATIEENGQRLIYLVDDLADFVRLKYHDIQLNLETVSLQKTITPILNLALGLSDDSRFLIVEEVPSKLQNVRIDPTRFQQMLLNLIQLAVRYSLTPHVRVYVRTYDNMLALSIEYAGSAPEAQYTEIDAPEESDYSALITRKLADLMGGKFFYEKLSENKHRLNIALPYPETDALDKMLGEGIKPIEHRRSEGVVAQNVVHGVASRIRADADTVLLVGDHSGQNRLLSEQLVLLDKSVRIVKNATEAMQFLNSQDNIALIICDVLLSDVSGIELTMNIRARYDIGLLPIILVIDSNQSGIAANAFAAGANDLIRRPFEKQEIIARVKNLLLQREASISREDYRALNRELEIARSIQDSLIPTINPQNANYKIEAVCLPARTIGGDLYDFFEDETSFAALIADVAGHGIPAALYAAMLKIGFHNLRSKAKSPEALLQGLNELIMDRGERTFVSCAYTLVDFKNKRLLHANAGHLPLLFQEPGESEVQKIHPPGGVLGVRPNTAFTVEMRYLKPGMRLMLLTDGVVEVLDKEGKLFDEERLLAFLRGMRDEPLHVVKEALLQTLHDFSGNSVFSDDVTFILLDV